MNIIKELDLIEVPTQISFKKKIFFDVGFELSILDNLTVKKEYIKRIYFLSSKNKTIRGNHAHLNQFQILILMEGSAKLVLTNRKGVITHWNLIQGPVIVPKEYWIELHMEESTNILCLASNTYEKLNSIYDKKNFLDS